MEGQMNKEQVIQATIGVLSEISVPVRLKAQIADPIDGAINNLAIVLQMIQVEKLAADETARKAQEGQEEAPAAEGEQEPGMDPIRLSEKREEAEEDGRDADAE